MCSTSRRSIGGRRSRRRRLADQAARPPPSGAPAACTGTAADPGGGRFPGAGAGAFRLRPDAPPSEADFKRAYAEAALKAGIAKDQAVRIYGFEASGNGRYDVQAGLETPAPSAAHLDGAGL